MSINRVMIYLFPQRCKKNINLQQYIARLINNINY